jgi:hypothetical protein
MNIDKNIITYAIEGSDGTTPIAGCDFTNGCELKGYFALTIKKPHPLTPVPEPASIVLFVSALTTGAGVLKARRAA